MMSRFQPLDQGIISLVKEIYTQYMKGELTATMETSDIITELAKKVTIFRAVLNTKVAWDSVPEVAIQKPDVRTYMVDIETKANQVNEDDNKVNDIGPMTITQVSNSLKLYSHFA